MMTNSRGKSKSQKSGGKSNVPTVNAAVPSENTTPVVSEDDANTMDESVPQETPVEQQQSAVPGDVTPSGEMSTPPTPSYGSPPGMDTPSSVASCDPVELLSTPVSSPSQQSDMSGFTSDTSAATVVLDSSVRVPGVLKAMAEEGASFETARGCWALTSDGDVRVNREYSLCFSLNVQASSEDVLLPILATGVEVEDITCVQYNSANHLWTVSFTDPAIKNQLMGLSEIVVKGHQCYLSDCENRTTIVKIFEAPDEMPDSVLVARLSTYGKVFSFRRDKCRGHIRNGVRTARMRLKSDIPSVVRIAGTYIRLWYPGQPKTCRRCGAADHFAASCQSVRCFNCEQPGHRFEDCSESKLCSVCRSPFHVVRECPYVVYAVNFTSQPSGSLYSDVVKTTSSEKPVSYASAVSAPQRPEAPSGGRVSKPVAASDPKRTENTPNATSKPSRSEKSTESRQSEEATKSRDRPEKRRTSDRSHDDRRSSHRDSSSSSYDTNSKRARHEEDRRRERGSSRSRESGEPDRPRGDYRDRDRERGWDSSHHRDRDRDRDRDRRRERDSSRDNDRGRSRPRRDRHRDHSSDSEEAEWTEVRYRHR